MSVHDDAILYQQRLVAVIEASPNRRAACLKAGIHPSTFYRWRNHKRRPTRVLSWTDSYLERQIVAKALAHPDAGPRRVRDLLSDDQVLVSVSKVWRVLKRHGLNTRKLRYRLLEQHKAPSTIQVAPRVDALVGSLDATVPGDLVQLDCFHVGSFKETKLGRTKHSKGQIWQYTAIDVASSYTWAELHVTPHNPDPVHTSALAHRVAQDLTKWDWEWGAATTDNGNEYRSGLFRDTLEGLGVDHRFIKPGRPQTNGKVERVQGTLNQEFYQPVLAGYVQPSITGLRRDLTQYLAYYNHTRRHYGKWNQGATPASIITPNPKTQP